MSSSPASRTALAAAVLAYASIVAACGNNETASSTSTGSHATSSTGADGGAPGTGGSVGSTTSASSGGAGGAPGTGGFMTAQHPAPPQVVNPGQGPVLTSPKVQLITWTSDPFEGDADAFVAELGTTSTWAEQTAEYGVGPFTALPPIHIADPAPASFDDDSADPSPFQQYLAGQLSGPNPAWGTADPNTMYLFVLPLGTDISSGGNCCSGFLGYHYEAMVGDTGVPYGIVCHCAMQQGDQLTPLQYVTTTIIHEMVELATDPHYVTNAAYDEADANHFIWTVATGGEISDMCSYNVDSNVTPPGATYMIQRSWSDAAAKAGQNPCVPLASADPYFNSDAVLPETITLDDFGDLQKTKGVTIPVGQSKTIDVELWSAAETAGPWTVTAYDLNDYLGNPKNLDVSLDKSTGKNGDVLKLTIKVLSKDKNLGGEGFVLQSDLNGQQNLSFGAIAN